MGEISKILNNTKSIVSRHKIATHVLLAIYGAVLAFIIAGLIFNFSIGAAVFFGLSFALLIFALSQCFLEIGTRGAVIFLVVSSSIGYVAEVIGTNFGLPFGKYYYTDFLGSKVLGVPIVVPLVWFVIAYLTFSLSFPMVGESLSGNNSARKLDLRKIVLLCALAAFGSVAWDLMIDPMFTAYGYWVWGTQLFPSPEISGIPLTNFLGWFIVVFLMLFTIVHLTFGRARSESSTPAYSSSTSSSAFWKGRRNTLDSRIAYVLLLLDGVVANLSLHHILVVVLGASAMLLFLAITYSLERKFATIGRGEVEEEQKVRADQRL
jgi:uncharacterized membrane protein